MAIDLDKFRAKFPPYATCTDDTLFDPYIELFNCLMPTLCSSTRACSDLAALYLLAHICHTQGFTGCDELGDPEDGTTLPGGGDPTDCDDVSSYLASGAKVSSVAVSSSGFSVSYDNGDSSDPTFGLTRDEWLEYSSYGQMFSLLMESSKKKTRLPSMAFTTGGQGCPAVDFSDGCRPHGWRHCD